MSWNFVGEHTFKPGAAEVNIGEFNLSEGQDTIWAKVTQLNEPGDWPFSFGILSWRSSEGNELGSIKIFPTQFGEVFRLTCGRAPLVGTGSIWFEPRGYNLQWIQSGFPWTLKFEAQAGRSALENQIWERANETIFPVNEGDALSLGEHFNAFSESTPLELYRKTSDENANILSCYSDVFGSNSLCASVRADGRMVADKSFVTPVFSATPPVGDGRGQWELFHEVNRNPGTSQSWMGCQWKINSYSSNNYARTAIGMFLKADYNYPTDPQIRFTANGVYAPNVTLRLPGGEQMDVKHVLRKMTLSFSALRKAAADPESDLAGLKAAILEALDPDSADLDLEAL